MLLLLCCSQHKLTLAYENVYIVLLIDSILGNNIQAIRSETTRDSECLKARYSRMIRNEDINIIYRWNSISDTLLRKFQ